VKNHWGGFVTHDVKRCYLTARFVALVYNWWSLFVRLADPDRHTEAPASRELLLYGASPRLTQDRSPVRESRKPGFARGERGNPFPYRDPHFLI
jgi:hypothetical protein